MQVRKLKPYIDQSLPQAKWNFDLSDIDKILRVDSEENIVSTVMDLLNNYNYRCEELE